MKVRQTLVSFFGLGSATATPLLYTYIKEHPEVKLTSESTQFFSDAKIFAKGLAWYESNFKHDQPGSVYGELSGVYLASAQSAGLIARTYPNAKLLAVIENPLVSVRVEYVEARRSRQISPDITLAMFIKRQPEILLKYCYGRQLVHYFSYYSPNDLLVLLASDIRDKPLESLQSVFSHIGLDDKFVPRSLRHLVVVEEDDTKKKPGLIKRQITHLKKGIKFLYGRVNAIIKRPEIPIETAAVLARKIPLTPELEKFLKDYYRKDVEQLTSLLHRNVDVEWGILD